MFIYVAALSVVFLAQSGVTAFIQAPAKRASSTRATWGGTSRNDAARHLAGPVQWEWVPDGAWGREAVRHKFRGQTREDLVCPAARALALKWGKACAVAYPALTVLAVCSIGPEGVT